MYSNYLKLIISAACVMFLSVFFMECRQTSSNIKKEAYISSSYPGYPGLNINPIQKVSAKVSYNYKKITLYFFLYPPGIGPFFTPLILDDKKNVSYEIHNLAEINTASLQKEETADVTSFSHETPEKFNPATGPSEMLKAEFKGYVKLITSPGRKYKDRKNKREIAKIEESSLKIDKDTVLNEFKDADYDKVEKNALYKTMKSLPEADVILYPRFKTDCNEKTIPSITSILFRYQITKVDCTTEVNAIGGKIDIAGENK